MSTLARSLYNGLMRFRGSDDRGSYRYVWDERRDAYAYADRLYDNQVYSEDEGCFQRSEIFKRITGRPYRRKQELIGHVNPIAGIVDAYQFCIGGKLGGDLKVERDGQDVAADVAAGIEQTWRDSRLDLTIEPYQHYAAAYGTTFLKVEADAAAKRVIVRPLHPKTVIDIELSSSGAVVAALLEYTLLEGRLGEDRQQVVYRERLTKDGLVRWKAEDERNTRVTIANALGVCPLEMVRHRDKGRDHGDAAEWGMSSWCGSDAIVHLINIRMSQLGLATDKALWAKWIVATAGEPPKTFPLSGEKVIHIRLQPDDPTPTIKALVEPINAEAAMKQVDQLMASLLQRQPEMVLTHLDSLSGQSGETIRKLLTPVTAKITAARARYETGLIAAIRQALSWQMLLNGSTREQADAAYRSGDLDFTFSSRPTLPPTPEEAVLDAKAKYADRVESFNAARAGASIVPAAEQLRVAGYEDADAKSLAIELEKQTAARTSRPPTVH